MERLNQKMKDARAQRRAALKARNAGPRPERHTASGSRRERLAERKVAGRLRQARRGSLDLTPLVERLAARGGTLRIVIELPSRDRKPRPRSRRPRRWPVVV